MNSETKNCQNCKNQFTIEPEDFNFYEKIKVPPPTFCPECRSQRRMLWRNERSLYRAACGLCGKNIVSMYDPKDHIGIYCDECWWSDKWDPMEYGISYDFGESFFSQWKKLFDNVPHIQLWKFRNIDCDYINYATDDKNCYLSYSAVGCEDTSYSYAVDKSQNILDSEFVDQSSWCYENLDSRNNYRGVFLMSSENCLDSFFLFDCANCQNCFMSSNLRNKKYVFRNSQYSKQEYETEIKKISTGSAKDFNALRSEFEAMKKKTAPHRFAQIINAPNSSGDHIENSKNIFRSFAIHDSENLRYAIRVGRGKDSGDIYGAVYTELAYESVAPSFRGSDAQFAMTNLSSRGIRYSAFCASSSDLFGCVGMRSKQYCILNKQYTKEEYEELAPRIMAHMNDMSYVDKMGRTYKYGEFFPPELSPYPYNETIAQEYFPLSKKDISALGYKWKDQELKRYTATKLPEQLPDNIQDVDDSILNEVIRCKHDQSCDEQCTQAFKITPDELQFYRKMNLPIPALCPNCRHYDRLRRRNPLKLWHRACHCAGEKSENSVYTNTGTHPSHAKGKHCSNEFETSYAPDRPEIVYCEQCYQAEVA